MKLKKDKTDLIDMIKIKKDKYYFNVYLWRTKEAFLKNTPDGITNKYNACCLLSPEIIRIDKNGFEEFFVYPKLGEIHFKIDAINVEIITHEVTHAIIQYIRMIYHNKTDMIIEQEPNDDRYETTHEELICYLSGRWNSEIIKWWVSF